MKRSILSITFVTGVICASIMATPMAFAADETLTPSATQTSSKGVPETIELALNDIINYKAPWLIIAKNKAADNTIGYSFESDGVFCTKFVYDCLKEYGFNFSEVEKEGAEPASSLSEQMDALETFGFNRQDGVVDFETLPAGSVIYHLDKHGYPNHVEFYLGTYDLDNPDSNGNPQYSKNGTPLTIGARITDRDPAAGDQLQKSAKQWYEGELGAFDRFSRGEKYWNCAYVPSEDTYLLPVSEK